MKRLDQVKTRFGGTPDYRRRLAIRMARDTLCAATNAASVQGALLVCQREEDAEFFVSPGVRIIVRPGLDINEAIGAGADLLRAEDSLADIASLPGDLPYLRSSELDVALQLAAGAPRSVVGDRRAVGTTLLTARGGFELAPAYGSDSFERHKAGGAVELSLPSWCGIRHDVDVTEDLITTMTLGRRTRDVVDNRMEGVPR